MKRDSLAPRGWCIQLAIAALFLAGSLAVGKPARADVDLRFDIGHAPRAGMFFHSRPHHFYDRGSGVYVIDDPYLADEDAFEYGGYYWVFNDGYWYRSSSWDGPFVAVSPRYVPTAIYDVPAYRWHHHPSYDSVHYYRAGRGDNWQNRGWRDTQYQRRDQWRNRDWRDRSMRHRDWRDRDRMNRDYRDRRDRNGDNDSRNP